MWANESVMRVTALIDEQVNPGSKAAQQGVREGDLIASMNDRRTDDVTNGQAHALLKEAGPTLKLALRP